MLEFPEHFFEEEVRDGFLVTEMMKRAWAAMLLTLDAVAELCGKYHLRWYASSGTLLGAVRHKGFIPWDDDIDIEMPRRDYMTLLEHAEELPEPYWILSIYSSDTFDTMHAVVKNNRGMDRISPEYRQELFHGFPFIVGIDIFPLDRLPSDPEKAKLQNLTYVWCYSLLHKYMILEDRSEHGDPASEEEAEAFLTEMDGFFQKLEESYGNLILQEEDRPLKNMLCRLADRIAMLSQDMPCHGVAYYARMLKNDHPESAGMPVAWFREMTELPFEMMKIPGTALYDTALSAHYGSAYMTPQRGLSIHEYPFFRGQAYVLACELELAELELRQQDRQQGPLHTGTGSLELPDAGEKQVLAYLSLASLMTEGPAVMEGMERALDRLLREPGTHIRYLVLDGSSSDILMGAMPGLLRRFRSWLDALARPGLFLDESGDYRKAIASCDSFYGDDGIVAELFKNTGKPMEYIRWQE